MKCFHQGKHIDWLQWDKDGVIFVGSEAEQTVNREDKWIGYKGTEGKWRQIR